MFCAAGDSERWITDGKDATKMSFTTPERARLQGMQRERGLAHEAHKDVDQDIDDRQEQQERAHL